MEDIKEALTVAAREKGICAEGLRRMTGTADTEALVGYYTENPDWCMERNFPSLGYLRAHFADIGDKGVFVDREFRGELLNDCQAYIFHHCRGTVKVGLNIDKRIIPMLYFANGCKMTVICEQRLPSAITVPIYETDGQGNRVESSSGESCRFVRYRIKLIEA